MLRLLSYKAQDMAKTFGKSASAPCHVGIHSIALGEYSQMIFFALKRFNTCTITKDDYHKTKEKHFLEYHVYYFLSFR